MRPGRTHGPMKRNGSGILRAVQRAPLLLAAVLSTAISSAAGSTEVRVGGRIVVVAGKKERVISLDEPAGEKPSKVRWTLERRISLRGVSPLWKRVDGSSISEDPAFRGREFTKSGELVGRPVDVTVRFELWIEAPRSVDGVKATVELDELFVAAHRYKSFLGYVRTVDTNPLDLGRLPAQAVDLRAGTNPRPAVSELSRGIDWRVAPGRKDVVRLAGRAYGLRGHCKVSLTSYGASSFVDAPDAQVDVRAASDPGSAGPRNALAARTTAWVNVQAIPSAAP